MRYLITEQQMLNFIRRNFTPEVYFDYIKENCVESLCTSDTEDDFLYTVGIDAVTDYLFDEGLIEEALQGDIARTYFETLWDEENSEALEYILEYYSKKDEICDDFDEDDEDF